MIKLLLLTALSFSSFSTLFADGSQLTKGVSTLPEPLSDSTIKNAVPAPALNGREGFKNLFEFNTITTDFSVKLNPLAVSFVDDYVKSHKARLTKMKTWGKPYFDMMSDVLEQHRLPAELKYIAVVESQLQSGAVSWAGAVGPWQFMPATARGLGLRVSKSHDERTSFTKSTHAAAKYLTRLYDIYNDWLLVVAAYNCGPAPVNSAIRRSSSRNFWELQRFLPAESRNHVKKFIATHYIMEGQGGVTTLTRSETDNFKLAKPATAVILDSAAYGRVTVSGRYSAPVIARHVGISLLKFQRLNPAFDQGMASGALYAMRLPADKLATFQERKPQILEESIRLALATAIQ